MSQDSGNDQNDQAASGGPSGLVIRPMQWAALPELHDTPDLDAADLACLAELRAVLARHGKLRRFAVHLAHRHFELGEGEVLIERPDPDGRTQHVTVGRLDRETNARPTTWLFDEGPELRLNDDAIYCICEGVDACAYHGKTADRGPKWRERKQIEQRRIAEDKAKYEGGLGPRPRGRHRSIRGENWP